MFKRFACLIVVCAVVGVYSQSELPPCKKSDDECMKRKMSAALPVIVKGIPSLNIENSDPLTLKEVSGDLSGLNYKFTNTITDGLLKCVVQKANLKIQQKTFILDIMCPVLNMRGDYKMSGNLLGLAIEGEGKFHIDCKNYNVIVDMEVKQSPGKDGKDHVVVKNFKLKGDVQGGVVFEFKNLFNGDKGLSDAVHKFANTNWKEVSEQFQGPVLNGNFKKLMTNVNKYLKSVPIDTLVIE